MIGNGNGGLVLGGGRVPFGVKNVRGPRLLEGKRLRGTEMFGEVMQSMGTHWSGREVPRSSTRLRVINATMAV